MYLYRLRSTALRVKRQFFAKSLTKLNDGPSLASSINWVYLCNSYDKDGRQISEYYGVEIDAQLHCDKRRVIKQWRVLFAVVCAVFIHVIVVGHFGARVGGGSHPLIILVDDRDRVEASISNGFGAVYRVAQKTRTLFY